MLDSPSEGEEKIVEGSSNCEFGDAQTILRVEIAQ